MISNHSVPTDTLLPHIIYPDVEEAIAWLGNAFGFVEHYRYGDPVSGAPLRIELFVDDPEAVQRQALAAGPVLGSAVTEHSHSMTGPRPIRRMLQGGVVDPFGHMWLIGKILD